MVIISRFFVGKYPKFLISEARELVIQDVSIVGQTKLKPVYDLMCIFHDHPKKKKHTHRETRYIENMPSSPN